MKTVLKFRNVYGTKQDDKFEHAKITGSIYEGNGVKGNGKYVGYSAYTQGGGKLAVLDHSKPIRLESNHPMITGHNGPVLDFDFEPFHDDIVATASEDTNIRLWQVPENFTENLTTPIQEFSAHQRKVTLCQFNPVAEDVLLSGSNDYTCKIWNVQKPDVVKTYQQQEAPTSLEWNINGSLIGSCWKDKNVRIIDPRQADIATCFHAHDGVKSQKFAWMSGTDNILTVGSSNAQKRQFKVWDPRDTSKEVQNVDLDTSSGVLYPFYDADLGILYLAGKGDGMIRYFEWQNGQFHTLTQHNTPAGKCFGFLPKRTVNVSNCEIAKCVKLTTDSLDIISFTQPRKGVEFQSDLFPDCVSGQSSVNADAWFEGKNGEVKRMSMNTEDTQKEIQRRATNLSQKKKFEAQTRERDQTINTKHNMAVEDVTHYKKEIEELHQIVHDKDLEIAELKEQLAQALAKNNTEEKIQEKNEENQETTE